MEKKINLIKLCVGINSLSELEERQSKLILPKKFKNSENHYAKCLSLPLYPTLKEDEQDYVIKSIFEFYE